MRHDPWRHQEKYHHWKASVTHGISGLSAQSSAALLAFLADMEIGRNTAKGTKRGARSYPRLNNLRQRLTFLARAFEQRHHASLTQVTEEQVHAYFGAMRAGTLTRLDGRAYRSTGDYVNVFKSFWHWHMRASRKRGEVVEDICAELDYRSDKAPWVYLTHVDVDKLCAHAKYAYRVLIMFLYDAGIRSPTELVNCRVRDFTPDCTQLQIRDEASKTFGRTIKLLLSAALVASYIRERNLAPDDIVFPIHPASTNRYLKRLAHRVLGDAQSPGGKRYCDLTLYDFRHSSACYWLPRYKSESALKYRFGWKKTDMIHYYTGFLGMRDTITQDDVLMPTERTEIERALAQTRREKALLEERLAAIEQRMQRVLGMVTGLADEAHAPLARAAPQPSPQGGVAAPRSRPQVLLQDTLPSDP
jgi:integrase